MMYSDNQTKNFYVVKSNDVVKVMNLSGTDKFRIAIEDNDGEGVTTTDILSEKLILNAKMNVVMPTYFRKWTVAPMAAVTADTTYSLYFYLENLLGFGLQDRWDIVASYTAKSGDSVATVMGAIKDDLIEKIGAVGAKHKDGPIANDFTVTVDGSNNIVVAENPASKTYVYKYINMLTHDVPYNYDLTLSTYDGNDIWGSNDKVIYATNTNVVRMNSGIKVMDMEHYFVRNRADIYDLNPNFGASIINELRAEENKNYVLFDVHYAFSDNLGFTYFSEKDMTIAVDTTNATAVSTLSKALNTNNSDMDSIGYIYDKASWAANYWRLADYFAAGNTGNKDEWNGDGWIVWNFPAGKYAGKTIAVTCSDGTTTYTSDSASATGTTSFFIASTTAGSDWYGDTAPVPTTFTTIDKIGTDNIDTSIS